MAFGQHQMVLTRLYCYIINKTPQVRWQEVAGGTVLQFAGSGCVAMGYRQT